MSSIKGSNTRPELLVRRGLWSSGIRYRVNDTSVFGVPDISIKGRKVAIFVDGCFWHGCPYHYRTPSTRPLFWAAKLRANKTRREEVRLRLVSEGWLVLEVWEHDVLSDPRATVEEMASQVGARTIRSHRPITRKGSTCMGRLGGAATSGARIYLPSRKGAVSSP